MSSITLPRILSPALALLFSCTVASCKDSVSDLPKAKPARAKQRAAATSPGTFAPNPAGPSASNLTPTVGGDSAAEKALNNVHSSRDLQAALDLLYAEAQAGSMRAQSILGQTLLDGKLLARNIPESLRWLHLAADKGDLEACHCLGTLFDSGHVAEHPELGIEADQPKADFYMLKAGNGGNAESQTEIGLRLLERGDCVNARWWLEKGAAQNSPQGLYNLALLVEEGKCGGRDWARAARLYERAAEAGFDLAITNLGVMYVEGRGRPLNLGQAAKWYLIGGFYLNLERCKINLLRIKPMLTQPDIAEAQRLAKAWWQAHGKAFPPR